MDMKVKDLIEQLEGFRVLAGEGGLEKRVSTVTVMDAPDLYNWMKGGEFLITTGYVMKDNPLELRNLVIKLKNSGASALGIKIGRFIDKLPLEVMDVANELNFPIIYIPTQYAFADIINPILSRIVNAQAKKLMMSENIHKSFTQLVIEGKKNSHIVDTLYGILNVDLAFIDLMFDKTYMRSDSKIFEEDVTKNLLDKYYKYPIQIGSSVYGYLVLNEAPTEDLVMTTLEHASTVLKLNIQKEISNHQIEQKYRDEFIQDLLVNNVRSLEEVNNRAALYGWKIEKGLVCLMVDIDDLKERFISMDKSNTMDHERDIVFRVVTKIMKRSFYKCYYTNYSDSIVFLIEPDSKVMEIFFNKLKKVSNEIRKVVKDSSNFTVTIGIGTYKESIIDVYISFVEAQVAVRIGRTVHGVDRTHVHSELGIYRILYNLSTKDDMVSFCNEYLKKLVDYDLEYNTNYVATLRCLVKNEWNLKKTSDDLFIHYNTMKYRFNKIRDIIKLDDSEDRFIVEFCLRLMDMSNQYSLYMKTSI